METTRFILFLSLAFVLTMMWYEWQQDYGDQYQLDQAVTTDKSSAPEDIPILNDIIKTDETLLLSERPTKKNTIKVITDVLDLDIDLTGATISALSLLDYPISKDAPDNPVVLLKNQQDGFYLIQGGLLSEQEKITHKTPFVADKKEYQLEDGEQEISVPLVFQSDTGLKVIKIFTFYRGTYLANVEYTLENNTDKEWVGSAYSQINRTIFQEGESRLIHTYTGAVISSPKNRYEKIDFDEIKDKRLSVDIVDGWVAMLQHYFITALIPSSKKNQHHYYTLYPDRSSYVIGMTTPVKSISVNTSDIFSHNIYFGPKTQRELERIANGLELTVDYGIFWFIAKPLFWLLDYIHGFTHNWGWSIILLTLLIKLVFYYLSAAGYRSMANMRRVQPRLIALKERFKDDRTGLNKAMMEIYKKEKINPLGGCLPILIQIPVFISLYWVLLESVELRQADFIFWINDLSIPDPYFVLPLLMGLTMFIQQKLNPTPMDPIQEKILAVLPIVFTVFFAFFPSGLVLYWVANNILSITQQWMITRKMEKSSS